MRFVTLTCMLLGISINFAFCDMITTTPQSGGSKKAATPNANPFNHPKPAPTLPATPASPRHVQAPVSPKGPFFSFPGIVGTANGQWVGSDNLFNLPKALEVHVELVVPDGKTSPVTEAQIKSAVDELFGKAGIDTHALPDPNTQAPLPMFHVLVFASSFDKGVIAACACRLFESITLDRVHLDNGIVFQAITWDKQELVFAPDNLAKQEILSTISGLTSDFLSRVKYFSDLKIQKDSH